MVYARETENRTFSFIVSGKLWRNSLIMQDRETGSLWSHITGEAIEGKMKGRRLEDMPAVQTTWADWLKRHGDTKLLKKEREVRSSSYADYFQDPDRIGIFRSRWLMDRMPGKTLVHGITRGPHALALVDEKVKPSALHNVVVGNDPVVAMRDADGGVHAWLARVDGRSLTFERTDGNFMRDKETGSTWDRTTGRSTGGEFEGRSLEELVVRTAFWFAWSQFYPNTSVFDRESRARTRGGDDDQGRSPQR